jgi:anti-sigma factor RsiW
MNVDHQLFQREIDESLAGALSAEEEQSLRQHLATCPSCREYLSASNRAIASLGGFSFEVDPALNARVMAALRLRAEEGRRVLARPHRQAQRHGVPLKNWAAFAVALSLSFAGSGFVYQLAERMVVPTHYVSAPLQAGVVVFWLMPSLCAAFCLLAAPREKGVV